MFVNCGWFRMVLRPKHKRTVLFRAVSWNRIRSALIKVAHILDSHLLECAYRAHVLMTLAVRGSQGMVAQFGLVAVRSSRREKSTEVTA